MYPFQIGDRVEAIVDFLADNTPDDPHYYIPKYTFYGIEAAEESLSVATDSEILNLFKRGRVSNASQ